MRMVIIPMRKRKHNEGIHKDTIRDAPRGCVARGKENIASRTALHRVRERMDPLFFRGIADGLCKLVPEKSCTTDRDADAGDKDPGQYQPAGTWNANQSI